MTHSKLLENRMRTLRLRSDAPFPRECKDHRDMIKLWRLTQRIYLAKGKKNVADPDK